jgi:hypothetical protein
MSTQKDAASSQVGSRMSAAYWTRTVRLDAASRRRTDLRGSAIKANIEIIAASTISIAIEA